ncbi:mechanosensitive ion channel family protein [Chryseolinea sp. T2]|uniref:mechanosensitive ion channel family protein n=1 Tax=Chryseolinea sp. T2 TaxID=3129255 RepID=UPI0030784D19
MEFERWTGLILKKLQGWLQMFIKMLPNMVIAALVLVVVYFIAKLVRRISYRISLRISHSDSVASVVSVVLQTLIMTFGLATALSILNLSQAVSSILAGVGIIGLALGFAFQDLSSNFISGLFMAFKRPFEIGDKVETNAFIGTIKEIKLRATTITTTAGLHVIIPNKDIFQKPIINYSRSDQRRVELDFIIMNTTDLEYAESVVRDAITAAAYAQDVEVYYSAVEDPKIKLTISYHIDNAEAHGFKNHRHQTIVAVYKALADHGIVKVSVPEKADAGA